MAATGITFVLLCAEIDLSIASIATFAGMMCAWFWVGDTISLGNCGHPRRHSDRRLPRVDQWLIYLLCRFPSFMMTLAMLTIAAGWQLYQRRKTDLRCATPCWRAISRSATSGAGHSGGRRSAGGVLAGHIILAYTRFGGRSI